MARRPLDGWGRRMWAAARFAARHREAWPPALASFLVRGGLVALLLPIVVIPSPVAVAAVFGVDAFTIAGQPTAWLISVAVAAAATALLWLAFALWLGSAVDVRLVQSYAGQTSPPRRGLRHLVAIRVVCLVPLAAVAVWAATQIGAATYTELQVPTSLTTPLPLRVLARTMPAAAVLVATWLGSESVAAIAVRRTILAGENAASALGGALVEAAKRPLSTLATMLAAYLPSIAGIGAIALLSSTAFDLARVAARGSASIALAAPGLPGLAVRPLLLLAGAVAVGVMSLAALAVAAVLSAWRSAAFTAEVAEATGLESSRNALAANDRGLGLSPVASERSGD